VLAGCERRLHLCVVEVVRRRDVDDVDASVGEHVVEARIRLGQARLLPRALRRRAHDAGDLDADTAQRLDVHDADEARSDDCRPHASVGV
jgi:hypothetical protein